MPQRGVAFVGLRAPPRAAPPQARASPRGRPCVPRSRSAPARSPRTSPWRRHRPAGLVTWPTAGLTGDAVQPIRAVPRLGADDEVAWRRPTCHGGRRGERVELLLDPLLSAASPRRSVPLLAWMVSRRTGRSAGRNGGFQPGALELPRSRATSAAIAPAYWGAGRIPLSPSVGLIAGEVLVLLTSCTSPCWWGVFMTRALARKKRTPPDKATSR